MTEQIGGITLDLTHYAGVDLYSDGPVEERLLKAASETDEDGLNARIASDRDWAELYHFSHIRRNILSWLPVKSGDKVLEIGSGCGAVTAALAGRAKSVTCVDLSKRRSQINAHRNRAFSNITIHVGNFQDIEPDLPLLSYDLICLIGVFEYAEGYIGGADPFAGMLERILPHLARDGILAVAIENRLGLKYFAGCREDHTGRFFDGIEDYPEPAGVRTFSKRELTGLFERVGGLKSRFYYPYPDYKFPMSLYSDARLPAQGEISENVFNFDRTRLQLFDEGRAFDALIRSGLFADFSNSFLVLLQREGEGTKEICPVDYVRFSNERAGELAVRTEVIGTEEGRRILKTWDTDKARPQIERLPGLYEALGEAFADCPFAFNRCRMEKEGVSFDYVDGESLTEHLFALVREGREAQAKEELTSFLSMLKESHERESFVKTPAFTGVFGDLALPSGLFCAPMTDIDLIPDNFLLPEGQRPVVIDYEWSFDFPIPSVYLLYRAVHYTLGRKKALGGLSEEEFYQSFGLGKELRCLCEQMEAGFQRYITRGRTPLRELYAHMTPGTLSLKEIAPARGQVFFSRGAGYSEAESVFFPIGENGRFQAEIALPAGTKAVRIDPGEMSCLCVFTRLESDLGPLNLDDGVYPGGMRLGNAFFLPAGDPQISELKLSEGAKRLFLEGESQAGESPLLEKSSELVRALSKERDSLYDEARRQREQIRQMEGTKVWKLYRGLKKHLGRKNHG